MCGCCDGAGDGVGVVSVVTVQKERKKKKEKNDVGEWRQGIVGRGGGWGVG